MAQQGVLPQELRDKLLQQHKDMEQNLSKLYDGRKQQQLQSLQEKMAQRRKKRFEKLRDEQEQRKNAMTTKMIQEGRNDELERELAALKRLFEQEMAAAEAEMDAVENEHSAKMTKTLSDEHTSSLKEKQRHLLKQATDSCPASEKVAMQRLLDQHRKDLEGLQQDLGLERERQLGDLKAKLESRRARRLADSQRKLEEEEAQRIIAEQRKQMQQQMPDNTGEQVTVDTGLIKAPKVNMGGESAAELALKKEQERIKADLKKQHGQEFDKIATKLEQEGQQKEGALKKQLDGEREKILRELKNKHAAELAARPDLSQDQVNAMMAQHEYELENLADKLENEKNRQMLALRAKMADRRQRKLEDLRRRQDVELTREMLEQKKEADELRFKKAKAAEREAIKEGIRDNGDDESELVIKAVLAQRQAQEMSDLDKQFAAQKRMMVDEALNKLNDKYDKLRDDMLRRHDQELADLEKLGLSPEELQQRRAELMQQHQQELSDLDRQHANEKGPTEQGALADWELAYAKAKLALKEKHYKEFAEALREFGVNKNGADSAEHTAKELEGMKQKLEKERLSQEEKMRKEQLDFEKEEEARMEAQMAEYARQLEHETQQEKEKHERNMEALSQRKEEMIRNKRNKMKEEVERLRSQGASEDEQKQLLEQHERDLQNLVNKIDADRLRMQSTLQERLRKRKEDKLKNKQKELVKNADEARQELDLKQQSQIQRMKADEALTMNEALNIDTATSQRDSRPRSPMEASRPSTVEESEAPEEPPTYNMAAPLNEGELISLLMASPLYQKLEKIKNQIEQGAHKEDKKIDKEGFQDAKDAAWSSDTKLEPVDLNKLDARKFIVYKFGCFVSELVSAHCQHQPITLLLADKIPPNERLRRNPYRNSFFYDANNNMLYIRTARLETVGEFVVVLVHTMAHIKSGDMRDDHNPDFLREYHRALAVVCDDLFFARFRQSTVGSIKNEPSVDGALRLLQNMFGQCHTEDEKVKMVDDLLDVKLLPATNLEGVHFNSERLKERLSQYSSYSMTNKLHTMLGSMEDKVQQARGQGSTHRVDRGLLALSHKYSPNGSCPISKKLPLRFVTANMTGHALWQTFANHAENDDQEPGEMPEQKSPADQQDDLCADFTAVNKALLDTREALQRHLETTSADPTPANKDKKVKGQAKQETKGSNPEQIARLKADLTRLEMEKQQIMEKMQKV